MKQITSDIGNLEDVTEADELETLSSLSSHSVAVSVGTENAYGGLAPLSKEQNKRSDAAGASIKTGHQTNVSHISGTILLISTIRSSVQQNPNF